MRKGTATIEPPKPAAAAAPARHRTRRDLPPTTALLAAGGDSRIRVAAGRSVNQYDRAPRPDPDIAAFGSSTASTISAEAFAAAERLRERLAWSASRVPQPLTYARELDRIRARFLDLCAIADLPDLAMVFAASGTDIHLLAGQLVAGAADAPTVAIMVEPAETGSRVGPALAGRHFSPHAALGGGVIEDAGIDGGRALAVVAVATRAADGSLRPAAAVDAEVEAAATVAATAGRHVLLVAIDVSKTGLIAPSLACTSALQRRFPETLDVLIDACQFRLAPATLRGYLQEGCMVALTGSKFLTGPAFSGALLVPGAPGERLRARPLPAGLAAYAARAEWPRDWAAARTLPQAANFGLLLRWEAALAELQAFRAVPEAEVAAILARFAAAVTTRLDGDPRFEPLEVAPLRRRPLIDTHSWDDIPSIFPFLLRRNGGHAPCASAETERVYRLLNLDAAGRLGLAADDPARAVAARRCEVGQPVACGSRDGTPLSALRLCASSRLVVAARHHGVASVIGDALATLDKIALIARRLPAA